PALLPPFPTRRSSDLARGNRQGRRRVGPAVHATRGGDRAASNRARERYAPDRGRVDVGGQPAPGARAAPRRAGGPGGHVGSAGGDRKSTRLNSSHVSI